MPKQEQTLATENRIEEAIRGARKRAERFGRLLGEVILEATNILTATFVLAVQDLELSKRFYVQKLGFVEDMSVDGWSFLSRGGCKLRIGDCPGIVPMSGAQDHSWFAYLHVENARLLYDEVVENGVEIWHRLEDKPWMMREFAIVTPDGHRIVFGESLSRLADNST